MHKTLSQEEVRDSMANLNLEDTTKGENGDSLVQTMNKTKARVRRPTAR